MIRTATVVDSYRLSPMQQGMLFHHLFAPDSGADIEQMIIGLAEPLDMAAFQAAWQATLARHEVLRSAFRWEGLAEPVQDVYDEVPLPLAAHDWRALDESEQNAQFKSWLAADRTAGFDVALPPLARLTVFRLADNQTRVVWTFHHLFLDGRSFPIVLKDVFAFYEAARAGEMLELPPATPYKEYIEWFHNLDLGPAERYWRERLAGFAAPTPLVVDTLGTVPAGTTGYSVAESWLSPELTAALNELARKAGVTMNTLVQGGWSLLLSRYSREDDVVFGATRACRHNTIPGSLEMAGLFINTLPMRVPVPPDSTLIPWLQSIREQHLELRDFEHTPLVKVQEWSDVPRGMQLFNSILVFENYQLEPLMQQQTGTGERVSFKLLEQTNYPLLLSGYNGDRLNFHLEYDRAKFDAGAIRRMLDHLETLLLSMTANPAATLAELNILPADERAQVTSGWNQTAAPYPTDQCVHELIAAIAARQPAATAVVAGDKSLSYAELNERANQLAHYLQAQGLQPDQFVGIFMDRSLEMVVALLGVLKAGAAYLPLDPKYPEDRLSYMLTDAQVQLVLTEAALIDKLPLAELPALALDRDWAEVANRPVTNPENPATPENLTYIIYTSGSTGLPKGVAIRHRGLVNHGTGVGRVYELSPADRVLQFAALSFDVAAEEIFATWLAGATVVFRDETVLASFTALHELIETHELTVLNLPAAYWSEWVGHLSRSGELTLPASLRLVIAGSEKVPADKLARWQTLVGDRVRWLNGYGPTEVTITSSLYEPLGAERLPGASVPIGRPIQNLQFYMLDELLAPVPIGIPGELHIGGDGLARGYLGRLELTAEKFIPDPFSDQPGARLYKSGDLARFLPDGNIEFMGRIDFQVKVRGFRIELGEIEAALTAHAAVDEAVVQVWPDPAGNNQLVAYSVTSPGQRDPGGEMLRANLAARLPEYMVPVAFQKLDTLPMTPSGKINRRALPKVDLSSAQRKTEYVAPRTALEKKLVQSWETILATSPIGINDSFFDVGGNSLLSIRLFAEVEALTGRKIQLATLFQAPTIAQLSALLDGAPAGQGAASAQGEMKSWVIPVKPTGRKTPFFHMGGATVLRNLINYVDPEQPIYGILEQDLSSDNPLYTDVPSIVDHCLAGIRSVQPQGPYMIGGLCFGGIVALELARKLRAEGEEVQLVLMIDSFAPGAITPKVSEAGADVQRSMKIQYHLQNLRHNGPGYLWGRVRKQLWRRNWQRLQNLYVRLGRPLPEQFRDVEEANTIASDSYQARSYDGDVTLFIASEKEAWNDYAPLNGWDKLIHGELAVENVVGGHLSVYDEPHVQDLARKLNHYLDLATQR